MATTIILTVISIAVGGVIAFLVTRWYYERTSGDLEREASELRDYTITLINYLDDARIIDVERDAHGKPVRVRVIKREVIDPVGISDSADTKLTPETHQSGREGY
jgi:hypothetical protein